MSEGSKGSSIATAIAQVADAAQMLSLTRGPPYAVGAAEKGKKKEKNMQVFLKCMHINNTHVARTLTKTR